MTRLALRYLTSADIPFADSLRAIAGWNQTSTDWQRFIDLSPCGCMVAECEGRPVATATTVCYGHELAWIGMILVHPDYRRRGIARVLLEHCIEILHNARIKSIKLDATPAGREVYLRLGFKDEYTLTRYAKDSGFGVPALAASAFSLPTNIRPFQPADLPQLLALDQSAIGARRENLLPRLLTESARALVYEPAPNQITAFGIVRQGSLASYLGPVISTNDTHAALLATALIADKTFCDLPDHNQAATLWAKSRDFTAKRTLTRMYLGQNVQPSAPESYFAIAAPDLG